MFDRSPIAELHVVFVCFCLKHPQTIICNMTDPRNLGGLICSGLKRGERLKGPYLSVD